MQLHDQAGGWKYRRDIELLSKYDSLLRNVELFLGNLRGYLIGGGSWLAETFMV